MRRRNNKHPSFLAGELLKQSEELIDASVHPTVITNGFNMAATKANEILNSIAIDATKDEVLKKVAVTSLTGKSVGEEESKLADLVVKACKSVEDGGVVDTKNIRIQKKVGGVIGDSYMVQGVVIDKECVHSRMPKKVENAKIALFECALEVKERPSSTHRSRSPILRRCPHSSQRKRAH